MKFEDLSPMAQAILDNVASTSHVLRVDFESKVSDHDNENEYLEYVASYIETILHAPQDYLEILNLDGKVELSYFADAVRGFRSGILQTLSIPVSMRNWMKEDSD